MSAIDAPNMPQTGDIIDGKYVLLRILGKGGMGIVFEAKHSRLPGNIAIKFLLKTNWNGPHDRERFVREARAGRKLTSEHSVRVTDMGEFAKVAGEDSMPYIVMEYLQGKDLDAFVQMNGPLPVPTAVDYTLQACIALAEAHAKKICHRDLKPSNLFVTRRVDGSPLVKVLDFGLAKDTAPSASPAASGTTTGFIALSPGYAPPEQQKGLRHADIRSDIYSISASLYFLLTGRCPFVGPDLHDIMISVARDPPTPLGMFRQDVHSALVDLIERCLAKSPAARPQTMTELAAALSSFGSPDAFRLAESVRQTALLTAQQAVPDDDDKATIQHERPPQAAASPMSASDMVTVPLYNPAQSPAIATRTAERGTVLLSQPNQHAFAPQASLVNQPKGRTDVRTVVVASMAAAVVATMVILALQFLWPNPVETVNAPALSAAPPISTATASAASPAPVVVDAPASATSVDPAPQPPTTGANKPVKPVATSTAAGSVKTAESPQKGYKKF